VSTTTATGGQHDVALNGSYRTPWTTLNGSYSQGEGYRQSGIGASGTLIAHRRRGALTGKRHDDGAD
jgi:outer membrane usher protein